MKLIVQVPCYNEEKTLPLVIKSIPKSIPGIDVIETMIIDDGSTDSTVKVARELGVTHIIKNKRNMGLAATFKNGLHACLERGADIIVNTDGDNQYPQQDIGKLVRPILDGKFDIVIGDRQVRTIRHFSPIKKLLQKIGSLMVKKASGVMVEDAPSGFRAYTREAAIAMNIVTTFSYTMETIIQAGKKRIAITDVPVITNPKTRESRLFKNIFEHVRKSTVAIVRVYTMYEPFKVFFSWGVGIVFLGILPFLRMAYLAIKRHELISGHIQSLIIGAVLIIAGAIVILIGVVADLLSINRKLLEENLYRLKKMEYDKNK